jgi:hypothetical protein
MDSRTGDTVLEFPPEDEAYTQQDRDAIDAAMARFRELMDAGYTAAKRTEAGQSQLLRQFDPTANETVFFARIVGG